MSARNTIENVHWNLLTYGLGTVADSRRQRDQRRRLLMLLQAAATIPALAVLAVCRHIYVAWRALPLGLRRVLEPILRGTVVIVVMVGVPIFAGWMTTFL